VGRHKKYTLYGIKTSSNPFDGVGQIIKGVEKKFPEKKFHPIRTT
jgi:hypothetical protein